MTFLIFKRENSMFLKKIAILTAAIMTGGFLAMTANADVIVKVDPAHEHYDNHDEYHHHDHRCHHVVYERVCHGSYHYQRCHQVRREFWRC